MKSPADLSILIDRIPFAEGNLGEEAILASLLQDLEAGGVKDITVLSNMPARTRQRHGVKVKVIPDRMRSWPALPGRISRADALIWGGGHMLQDRSSRLYIPYVIKSLLLARALGLPRGIYAPGMGPVKKNFSKTLARTALRRAALLTVRDTISAQFLDSIGLEGDYVRTADPAFSLTTPWDDISNSPLINGGPGGPATARAPIIGFAPRRHFYRRGSWLPVSWQLAAGQHNPLYNHYLQEAAAALDMLVVKRGAKIRLIPMDLGPNPRDDLVCMRLRTYMVHPEAAEIQDDDPPLFEFVRRLGELDLLISDRLHGIILGMRFGLPFIGMDSDGKIEHLAVSLGLGRAVIPDREMDRDRLFKLALEMLDRGAGVRTEILRHGIILRDRAKQNRVELARFLNNIARQR
jgi:polysaccharide pyruvyl transferase WcaK-like protein